ncbi:MAG: SoxR reducing system RseC family protein [Clostridiales bacterium]|nr:SoxR reducing system RseC family protein [Clostridiales bacterium]
MKEYGIVLSVENGNAIVGLKRSSACSDCGACELGSNHSKMEITLANTVDAKPGDTVEIQLPTSQFLKASAILYLIPLVTLIIGIVLGHNLGKYFNVNADIIGAITGVLFTVGSYMSIKKLEPRFKKNIGLSPTIIAVYRGMKGDEYNGK